MSGWGFPEPTTWNGDEEDPEEWEAEEEDSGYVNACTGANYHDANCGGTCARQYVEDFS